MKIRIPRDLLEYKELYSTEEKCMKALIAAKWPDGFVCPKCKHTESYIITKRNLLECKKCKHQTSPMAETIFHSCKLPLPKIFRLMYLVLREKAGTNNSILKRQLSISRRTAQLWSRKIRASVKNYKEKQQK